MTQTLSQEQRRVTLHVQVVSQSEHWACTQTNFAGVKVETMRTLLKYYMAWIKCIAVAIMKNRNRGDINVNGVFAINYQIMLLVTMDNLLSHCITLLVTCLLVMMDNLLSHCITLSNNFLIQIQYQLRTFRTRYDIQFRIMSVKIISQSYIFKFQSINPAPINKVDSIETVLLIINFLEDEIP